MVKRLPPEKFKYLLDMYNRIWEEREIPKTWKQAAIKTLLNKGKDPKDIRSYKPVALTNILCKNIWKDGKKETGLVSRKGEENRRQKV